ncbi:hypothetical protein BLNAU_13489 [Blattamonas nauphoetae]|uniref:Uncharacterized protein n=1 Tax=Blattamonas nauphoetae TaxID=2049346 RepID=A0ABQ9XJG7_9EUKA|nr:hypothetical protein BLNAU_13489 [Blattamonas nauphoetae]
MKKSSNSKSRDQRSQKCTFVRKTYRQKGITVLLHVQQETGELDAHSRRQEQHFFHTRNVHPRKTAEDSQILKRQAFVDHHPVQREFRQFLCFSENLSRNVGKCRLAVFGVRQSKEGGVQEGWIEVCGVAGRLMARKGGMACAEDEEGEEDRSKT